MDRVDRLLSKIEVRDAEVARLQLLLVPSGDALVHRPSPVDADVPGVVPVPAEVADA